MRHKHLTKIGVEQNCNFSVLGVSVVKYIYNVAV